ncbi:SgcJ/EcaC family oxidoreductase [Lentzea sp. BCCO 10_0798]|uniref:SgcJ/EcaC family oxidoreductase n=1 Tax=Lentzea kristufekii TaxID=3095430 RepID=A0ABU4U821_9PSEU|nr:SgcJ/EcaC family oxidoreductase [Lentzea sp. BCCO 10_0798]MDX8056748.1 SgcJ/EcaC family oxidoreductase [Lentzea sp. BCCO 10_0798]
MTEQIYALWQRMEQGWALGDGAAFASVFAEDVDFVTVRGEELFGRHAVAAGHSQLFAGPYRDTKLTAEISLIRPLSSGISVVHVTSSIAPAGITTHAQAVVVRREDGWEIAAFHNMIPKGRS